MQITTKQQLRFFIEADYMMNRGKFRLSLRDKLKRLIFPDYIMSYLIALRCVSFYRVGGVNLGD